MRNFFYLPSLKASLRAISFFVLMVFGLEQIALASPMPQSNTPVVNIASLADILREPEKLNIPFQNVSLKEIHKGGNQKLVILIEDAHANYSGQMSLAVALEHFMTTYGIKLILSEGSAEDSTLTDIKQITDSRTWKIAARRFLMDGIIKGSEYVNLTTDLPIQIRGIEYQDLYDQSLEVYAKIVKQRKNILLYIHAIRSVIDQIKSQHYPKSLLAYEEAKRKDEGGSKGNLDVLLDLAEKSQVDRTKYAEVTKLLQIREKEKTVDFLKANDEQSALLSTLQGKGAGDVVKSYLDASKRSKNVQIAQFSLLGQILDLAKANGIGDVSHPTLLKYHSYLADFMELNPALLLSELDILEDEVYKKMLPEQDARRVRVIERFVDLLEKAYNLKLSSDDFEMLRVNEPDFKTESWEAYVNARLVDLRFFENLLPYEPYFEEARDSLMAFYALVRERDNSFIENGTRIMNETGENAAVMITGGYHTANLTRLMREAGLSYVVLTLVVSQETNHEKYEKLLLLPLKAASKNLTKSTLTAKESPDESPLKDTLQTALLKTQAGRTVLVLVIPSVGGIREELVRALVSSPVRGLNGVSNDTRIATGAEGARMATGAEQAAEIVKRFQFDGYAISVIPLAGNEADVEIAVPAVIGAEGFKAKGRINFNDAAIAERFSRIAYDVANFGEGYGGPEASVRRSLRELGITFEDRQVTEAAKRRTIDQVRSDLKYELLHYNSMELVEKKGAKATAREFIDFLKAAVVEAKQMKLSSGEYFSYIDSLNPYATDDQIKLLAIQFFYNGNGLAMSPTEARLQKKFDLLEEFYRMRGDLPAGARFAAADEFINGGLQDRILDDHRIYGEINRFASVSIKRVDYENIRAAAEAIAAIHPSVDANNIFEIINFVNTESSLKKYAAVTGVEAIRGIALLIAEQIKPGMPLESIAYQFQNPGIVTAFRTRVISAEIHNPLDRMIEKSRQTAGGRMARNESILDVAVDKLMKLTGKQYHLDQKAVLEAIDPLSLSEIDDVRRLYRERRGEVGRLNYGFHNQWPEVDQVLYLESAYRKFSEEIGLPQQDQAIQKIVRGILFTKSHTSLVEMIGRFDVATLTNPTVHQAIARQIANYLHIDQSGVVDVFMMSVSGVLGAIRMKLLNQKLAYGKMPWDAGTEMGFTRQWAEAQELFTITKDGYTGPAYYDSPKSDTVAKLNESNLTRAIATVVEGALGARMAVTTGQRQAGSGALALLARYGVASFNQSNSPITIGDRLYYVDRAVGGVRAFGTAASLRDRLLSTTVVFGPAVGADIAQRGLATAPVINSLAISDGLAMNYDPTKGPKNQIAVLFMRAIAKLQQDGNKVSNIVLRLDGLTDKTGEPTDRFQDALQMWLGINAFVKGLGGHFSVASDTDALIEVARQLGFATKTALPGNTTYIIPTTTPDGTTYGDDTSLMPYLSTNSGAEGLTVANPFITASQAVLANMVANRLMTDPSYELDLGAVGSGLAGQILTSRSDFEQFITTAAKSTTATQKLFEQAKPFLATVKMLWAQLQQAVQSFKNTAWSA